MIKKKKLVGIILIECLKKEKINFKVFKVWQSKIRYIPQNLHLINQIYKLEKFKTRFNNKKLEVVIILEIKKRVQREREWIGILNLLVSTWIFNNYKNLKMIYKFLKDQMKKN